MPKVIRKVKQTAQAPPGQPFNPPSDDELAELVQVETPPEPVIMVPPGSGKSAASPRDNLKGLNLVRLSSIEAKDMAWAWEGVVPVRGVTVIAGEGGVGKTLLALAMAACISKGKPFPGGSVCEKGIVLYFSAEDDAETQLRPRCDAAGADCDNIIVQGRDASAWLDLGDKDEAWVKALEEEIRSHIGSANGPVRAIIFDPLTSFVQNRDLNGETNIRAVYKPLTRLAQTYDLAIIVILHFGKDTEINIKYRALGGVAFVNAARSAWAVGKEYEDAPVTHFLQIKKNYTGPIAGHTFTVEKHSEYVGKLVWGDAPSPLTPGDLGKGNKKTALAKALTWIKKHCDANGAVSVSDANLQQSGLPGTRNNADYCRDVLRQLAAEGKGTLTEDPRRKSLSFAPLMTDAQAAEFQNSLKAGGDSKASRASGASRNGQPAERGV
jgi:hypothetical protein